jgi:RNA polymerase sigma-70 factor (ECF subfamily)
MTGPVLAQPALEKTSSFRQEFGELFEVYFHHLYRFLDRLTGEPDLAADLAQETFIRLYQRGSMPDMPPAWLISVAMNLFRNAVSSRKRRDRLLTLQRGELVHSDPEPPPDQLMMNEESGTRVRMAIDRMPHRERELLLLRAEGYSYREIAAALELNEASVGVMLARARQAFRRQYQDTTDAS